MVREDCWREVHRLFPVERQSKSEIARQLALDRKTVRTILREPAWRPYRRAERTDTLLIEHREETSNGVRLHAEAPRHGPPMRDGTEVVSDLPVCCARMFLLHSGAGRRA